MSVPLTYEEKLAKGLEYKDEGNKLFLAGEYQKALQQYHSATAYLAGLDRNRTGVFGGDGSGDAPDASDKRPGAPGAVPSESKKQLSLVQSNMAACLLKLAKYQRALQCSSDALKHDDTNVKAFYRKCSALRLLGELSKAETALDEFVLKHPAQKANYDAEMKLIKAERAAKQKAADKNLKGFLNKK